MLEINYLEWIGYIGSVIIAISLTMTSMVKLRWLNFVGALIFTIYGVAINAIPVALVNGFITLIDLYYLYKMYTSKDYFTLLDMDSRDPYLSEFFKFYEKGISKEFPDFNMVTKENQMAILILRNMTVASVFIGHLEEDSTLVIDLDFAIPQYQDLKTGHFLLVKKVDFLKAKGAKKITFIPKTKSLQHYYTKMGFTPTPQGEHALYSKSI